MHGAKIVDVAEAAASHGRRRRRLRLRPPPFMTVSPSPSRRWHSMVDDFVIAVQTESLLRAMIGDGVFFHW